MPRIVSLAVALSTLAACIIVPVPTRPLYDISPAQRQAITDAKATRRDILMKFGSPELRLDGDRVFVYRWNRERAGIIGATGGALPIYDVEAVFLEFGRDGRLVRTGMATAWLTKSIGEQAEAWARQAP